MNPIKQLRLEKGLTQTALQIKIGIDQTILSKYETGERVPTTENLIILADFYQTSLDFLVGRTEERRPYPKMRNE